MTGYLLADAHFLGWHFPAGDIALHYLGIHALFGSVHEMSVNDSFWFVTLIVCLYLLYAPMRRLMGRPGWILLIGIAVSLAPAAAGLLSVQAAGFEHIAERVPGFFVGLLVGRRVRTGRLGLSPIPALLGGLVLLVGVPYASAAQVDLALLSLAITGAYVFLAAPALPGPARSPLRFLGVLSLEIFLIHQPLIREYNILVHARLFPGAPETPWALAAGIAAGLAATIALSAGLHRVLAKVPAPRGIGPRFGAYGESALDAAAKLTRSRAPSTSGPRGAGAGPWCRRRRGEGRGCTFSGRRSRPRTGRTTRPS